MRRGNPSKQNLNPVVKVVAWQRRAEVLTRPKLPCLSAFHTINLSAGCPNECRYCYAQSYAHHREKLVQELARLRRPPRLVYFSTTSEPFLPAPRVLDEMHAIMTTLLKTGAALLISTKGIIPERFIKLFSHNPGKVVVQVGITTVDENVRRLIEPRAASVPQRLDNLERLSAAGISAEARLDPLIPGLTDTDDNFEILIPALVDANVSEAVVSFLFLRWGIDFSKDLSLDDWSARKMRRLYTHKVTDYCGGGTIWLPEANYRAERFKALESIGTDNGLTIKLCRCKNSDLSQAQCCHPTESLLETSDPGDPCCVTYFVHGQNAEVSRRLHLLCRTPDSRP